jgi:hypothetical protein
VLEIVQRVVPAGDAPLYDDATTARLTMQEICASDEVQRSLATTIPAGLGAEERRRQLDERRADLGLALKRAILRESLRIEESLLPYLPLDGAPVQPAWPTSCPVLQRDDPGGWAALQAEAAELARHRDRQAPALELVFSDPQVGSRLQFLAAVYELSSLRHLSRVFRHRAVRPDGVDAAVIPLGAIVPAALLSPHRLTPHGKVLLLHQKFPLLARPHGHIGFVPRGTVAQHLFAEYYLDDAHRTQSPWPLHDRIVEQLASDIGPHVRRRYDELARMSAEEIAALVRDGGYALELDGAAVPLRPEQRRYLLAWQLFLRADLPHLVVDKSFAAAGRIGDEDVIRQTLAGAARRWQEELRSVRDDACHSGAATLESRPELLVLYLQRHADERAMEHLDAVCNHPEWGRYLRRQFESAAYVAGTLTLVAALLTQTAPLIPVAMALNAGSFLSTAERVYRDMTLDGAIFNLDIADRRVRQAAVAVNLAGATITAIGYARLGLLLHGGGLQQAWRLLVPYVGWTRDRSLIFTTGFGLGTVVRVRKFLEQGKNPLREGAFWMGVGSSYITSIAFTRMADVHGTWHFVRELALGQVVGASVDMFVQHGRFLLDGQPVLPRTVQQRIWWDNTAGVGNKVLFFGLRALFESFRSRLGPLDPVAFTAYCLLTRYVTAGFSNTVELRYIYNRDLSFADALMSFRFSDYVPRKRDIFADEPSLDEPQLQALQTIYGRLRTDEAEVEEEFAVALQVAEEQRLTLAAGAPAPEEPVEDAASTAR